MVGVGSVLFVLVCMWELSQIDFAAQGECWGVP